MTMCGKILLNAYAKHLKPLCLEAVTQLCHGCVIEHPSQDQHNVCLLDEYDRLMHCWNDAYNRLDESKVSESITHDMDIMTVLCIHRYTFFDLKWRRQLCKSLHWRELVVREMMKSH